MKFERSKELLDRAYKVIPSATQTFSKGPSQWPTDGAPNYLERGDGAWVWDADGNKFLDYLMALGPIILGYGHRGVTDAIEQQLRDGIVFSQMHPLEVVVAEMIVERVSCSEMVRFAKNGSDATTGAIRAARAFTGRDRVAICGYHGWHDWYISTTSRRIGIPAEVSNLSHTFEYNNIDSLKNLFDQHKDEIAAVILEPVGVIPPENGFLENVRQICSDRGAILIFDEIVTGFRFAIGGAQEVFGVIPDLACFGKAMANGMPLAAVTGKRDVMNVFDDIFFSGTFGGDALSLAACKATIEALETDNAIDGLWQRSQDLVDGINGLIKKHRLENYLQVLGYPIRSVLVFTGVDGEENRLRRTFLMQKCIERGLLYFCSHVPCIAHGKAEIRFTLEVLDAAFAEVADAIVGKDFHERLIGEPVQAIFRSA